MKTIEGYAGAITGNEDNKRWDVLIQTKYGKVITLTTDRDIAWELYCNPIKIEIGEVNEKEQH